MKILLLAVIGLGIALPSVAQERKTIYVHEMEGLESFVEEALRASELPFDFIEEKKQPDFKAALERMHSAYGEVLYKHKLGRNETHRLEFRDVNTNKVIASHSFALGGDDESRRRAAAVFAGKVKKALTKKGR